MMENYQIRQIDEHTWQLLDPFRTYLYVLEGTEKAILLDAGNGFSGLRETVEALTKKPVTVVLTHGHFDHTGGAAEFSECLIHQKDAEVLKEGFDPVYKPSRVDFFSRIYDVPLKSEEREHLIRAKQPEHLQFIKNGEILDLGGRTLEVIETPAHTGGSICLLDRENGYLFSGDTVCNREILVYFDHSTCVEDVKRQNEKLLMRRNEFTQIWPGHHECPLDASILEDYRDAAEWILRDPKVGEKIMIDSGYKYLYNHKSIGISYTEDHVFSPKR